MTSESDKNQIFFKLIALQRKTKQQKIKSLKVDGEIITDQKTILEAWASHFNQLGTESSQPHFDEDHYQRIKKTRKCISSLISITKPYANARPILNDEVEKAIRYNLSPKPPHPLFGHPTLLPTRPSPISQNCH